jgi:hypothetical protein
MEPQVAVGETGPITHLAIADNSDATACRRQAKRRTRSAASVTCPPCQATWDFAEAARRQSAPKGKRIGYTSIGEIRDAEKAVREQLDEDGNHG